MAASSRSAKRSSPASAVGMVAVCAVMGTPCHQQGSVSITSWVRLVEERRAVAASAGKNASIESSATVTSTAVPNVATVLKNVSSRSPWRSTSGTAIAPCGGRGGAASRGARVALDLREQLRQPRVGGRGDLAPQAVEQVPAPLARG